jgi:hypothetical protein
VAERTDTASTAAKAVMPHLTTNMGMSPLRRPAVPNHRVQAQSKFIAKMLTQSRSK